ncbi:MlaD family protein [Nocardia sp. NPDC056100]|uniref:MlaD family protein n=1 Tax=Nocardia sp. NPDC056100 TaxID=3345712 RepID=UPI0035DC9424
MSATPWCVRLVGAITAAAAAAAVIGWHFAPQRTSPDRVTVQLLTESVGNGIESGSDVRLDGVRVGSVAAIATAGTGRQSIHIELDRTQITGLTDALGVDYAPGNLFGVSEIELRPGSGGAPLRDRTVVDLTGDRAVRARDATISTLLRSLGQLTNDVVTPQMISVLHRIASDTRAFTPLFQAIVTTAQSVADTQRLPSSYLLRQYGSTLAGVPPTVQGVLDVLNAPYSDPYLRQPDKLAKFDASVSMVANNLIGALTGALDTGNAYYAGCAGVFVPLLSALAGTVPDPDATSDRLTELLRRVGAAMPETPDGPMVNITVDLRGVPALAVPLSALLDARAGGGQR